MGIPNYMFSSELIKVYELTGVSVDRRNVTKCTKAAPYVKCYNTGVPTVTCRMELMPLGNSVAITDKHGVR